MENTRREFINTIEQQFQDWCELKEIEPNSELLIEYLINRSLIIDKTINRFLVVDKYPALLEKNLGCKLYAVYDLEEIVGVKESMIQVYLQRHQKDFRFKNRVNIKK